MAKIKNITNANATIIAALWASEGEEYALNALAKTGFTKEQLADKLAHMAKIASKSSKSAKGAQNAALAEKIVAWLIECGAPATSVDIMKKFNLKSASKVSIVMRETVASGCVLRGRTDEGKITYRLNDSDSE